MSIGATSAMMYTKFDAEMNALFALSNKSKLSQDSIFNTNNGLPNLLAANQSIFGAGQNAGQAGAIGELLGFQSFGNGAPGLDLATLTALSSQKEEALIADSSAGAVNAILNLKIPPLPDQEKAGETKPEEKK